MDKQTDAASTGGASDIVQISAPGSAALSPREAARTLSGFRLKQREARSSESGDQPEARSAPAPQAVAAKENEAAEPSDTTSPERASPDGPSPDSEAPASAASETEMPDVGTLEPPPSWSKEARERWARLDRGIQDFLHARESTASAALAKAQNEAAAERQTLEQARQQYENVLPQVLAALQQEQTASFADIKSIEDIEKLARDDWPRYLLWDAQQKRLAAMKDQLAAVEQRQSRERDVAREKFIERELERFVEKAPELANPAERAKVQSAAIGMLHELGFSEPELREMWQGHKALSLHDHRLHLLIRDGLRFREARNAARHATAKPLPPVQRPGVGQPKGAAQEALVQNLARRLDQTGNLKDAARLLVERRRAR
jgi:hypothetical protein